MSRFWKTPPELYNSLDQEFNFDFDPCPCPRPQGYNSLDKDWKEMNYLLKYQSIVRPNNEIIR